MLTLVAVMKCLISFRFLLSSSGVFQLVCVVSREVKNPPFPPLSNIAREKEKAGNETRLHIFGFLKKSFTFGFYPGILFHNGVQKSTFY